MVLKVWKMARTMARPTAASAAASTMTKSANTWPVDAAVDVVVEGDEVHVRAVQDELDAHQDADRVAAGGDRDEPEREEQRADDEEVRERDHEGLRPSVGLDLLARHDDRADERREEHERGDLEGQEPRVRKRVRRWRRSSATSGPGVVAAQGVRSATARSTGATATKSRTPPARPKLVFETFTSVIALVSMTANSTRTRTPPM